ncbi:MAG TPA: hypothetical protein VF219_03085 [Vicinamibacterales bacterium]
MSDNNDKTNISPISELDRRTVISSVLAVGGAVALGGSAAAAVPHSTAAAVAAEREWARTLARTVSNQLPEAARQLPGLCLSSDQIEELRRTFENTLVTNMGCTLPPS